MDVDRSGQPEYASGSVGKCFTLIFPMDIVLPNGSTLTTTDEYNLEEAVEAYFEENPDTVEDPKPVYPITVRLEDGADQVIDNDEDFEVLIIRCDSFHEDDIFICFDIEYPITIIYPNGTSDDLQSDDELKDAIAIWESTSTGEEEPTLNYPVKIVLEDGTPVTITNDEELEDTFDACYEDCEEDTYPENCFDIVFPITMIIGDDKQVFNSQEEIYDTKNAWEEANPNSPLDVSIEYPITITHPDGTQDIITSQEELEDAYDACEE